MYYNRSLLTEFVIPIDELYQHILTAQNQCLVAAGHDSTAIEVTAARVSSMHMHFSTELYHHLYIYKIRYNAELHSR